MPNTAKYTVMNGYVIDNVTNLYWEHPTMSSGGRTWTGAQALCSSLNANGGLGGFTDWRLPTRIELVTLFDYTVTNTSIAPINAGAFPGTPMDPFWTSSLYAPDQSKAWLVSFVPLGSGNGADVLSGTYAVRCVRSGC